MKINVRKLISLLLTATLFFSFGGTALAGEPEANAIVMEESIEEVAVEEQPVAEAPQTPEEQGGLDKMDECILIENTFSSAIPLDIGKKVQVGQRAISGSGGSEGIYYNVHMKYRFVVDKPSQVKISLSTEETLTDQRRNVLTADLYCENTSTLVYSDVPIYDKYSYFSVYSNELPLEKELSYKVMPGTYYLTVDHGGALNAFGWAMLKSITPTKADTFGEPNDTVLTAKTIKTGVTYGGNITYSGRTTTASTDYRGDSNDYYKFSVPFDGCTLKLTASRPDKDRTNNVNVALTDANGYQFGNSISLISNPSGSIIYKDLKKGVYHVRVGGNYGGSYPTEYTFKVEYPVKVTGVTLNKTSASLLKGNSITLKAAVSPSTATYKAVTWKSSNTAVASVNSKGVVTGKAKGVVNISAITKDGAKVAKCRVAVKLPA